MARILILDDDAGFRAGLAEALGDLGHEAVPAATVAQALAHLAAQDELALAFVDLRLPDEDGLSFLRRAGELAPQLPCVVLTAHASGANTIEAMRLGAFDHLTKPLGRQDLQEVVRRALAQRAALAQTPATALPPDATAHELVGSSEAMRRVLKRIGQAAASDVTVLVLGETGTGKELVARALHRHSERRDGPFVAINCAAVPAELLESELFGHVKGAFTGATQDRLGCFRQADGGTLFLDEIGDMTLAMQAKMLRVLQQREVTPVGAHHSHPVDVRVVAATHRPLHEMVAQGRFRSDLWYRLNVLSIELPPLRERLADVVLLAEHFLRASGSGKRLSPAAARALLGHRWPGNVRELRNAIERAVALTSGPVIEPAALGLEAAAAAAGGPSLDIDWDGPLEPALATVERMMLQRALAAAGGNRAEAARRLGLHRQQLYRKLQAHGLD
ncbi:MAG: acetoacetate metabolism regulatory protein AtoC [Caldimonas sp.]|uniref:sigma-54-dependent transcriptional regulator n=1 Tax=Caldimonas taiwanensis TaxID=307483 RepID=UPI000783DDD6|nr:sigma-54 dependent transcriptional regulator [Caldimonas taiwanensis]GIX24617.1 MAG: acetoacetate metabolism regulatory protein AtoC [Caldimonas sp.]